MPASVKKLMGRNCAKYLDGHCLRMLSPVESAASLCPVMAAKRRLGAEAQDRLRRLTNLADPAHRDIGRRHVLRKTSRAVAELTCEHFTLDHHGQICRHIHQVYCLRLLPTCSGLCDEFMPRRTTQALRRKAT